MSSVPTNPMPSSAAQRQRLGERAWLVFAALVVYVALGQDGFYNPAPAGSISITASVYTYAGNVLGIVTNPGGGDQFVAGTGRTTRWAATCRVARPRPCPG